MSKITVSQPEIIKEILKELKKESTRIGGKLIRRAAQIPPVLLQEDHETYMLCKRRVYAKKWHRQKVSATKLIEQGLSASELVRNIYNTETESHAPNSRKGSTYKKWSPHEMWTLKSYASDYGHEIGCKKASSELKRSFSSCKCKLGNLLRKESITPNLQQKFYERTPETKENIKPTQVSVPVTKDIEKVDVQGYKITITYKNGSIFIFNMETQEVSINL